MPYSKLTEVADALETYLVAGQSGLGIAKIIPYGDELVQIGATFPVLMLVPETRQRELRYVGHQIDRMTLKRFRIYIYVMHANMTQTRPVRLRTDLAFAEAVTDYIDQNPKLDGNIVNGFVTSEAPTMMPGSAKNTAVIGTRLTWEGEAR